MGASVLVEGFREEKPTPARINGQQQGGRGSAYNTNVYNVSKVINRRRLSCDTQRLSCDTEILRLCDTQSMTNSANLSH